MSQPHLSMSSDRRPEGGEELADPGWVGGPGGGGDEVGVGVGVVEGGVGGDEFAAGELDLGFAGRIGADAAAFDDAGGGEELRAVADGGDGLFGRGEVLDDGEDAGRQAEVFGARPPGMTRAS